MPELLSILEEKNDQDFQDKKFFASLQGVDLEGGSQASLNKWEQIKAKACSGGATANPNDILALQGKAAQRAGFGIGVGLDYEVIE